MQYDKPTFEVIGHIDRLTREGGGSFVDVPEGTPTNDNTTIGDVTGDSPFTGVS